MDIECTHCPGVVSYRDLDENKSLLAEAHQLFHQPCQKCVPTTSGEDQLCPICRHLRINHLVRCIPLDTRHRFLFQIRPNLFGDFANSRCTLCRLVVHMVSLAFGRDGLPDTVSDDWSLSLFLGSQHEQSNSTAADIYLQFRVGDEGMSNMWVGDIHIASMGDGSVAMPCVGTKINWPRLRDAIQNCVKNHDNCQRNKGGKLPQGFRLINIARRCIVETSQVPFIALSYVWGKDTRASLLTATLNTIDGFKREGGLGVLDMPKTIEDAMQICTELDVNYLWADRLCIIQDDPVDKMHQIMAMNGIYESASLVIVSAYGDSMDFGVHGVSRVRSATQRHEEVHGLLLTNLVREESENPLALWQTRGWTYQEAVCAKRLLHLTNTRAHYECQTSICHEDLYNTATEVDEFTTYGLRLEGEGSQFKAFARHLTNYTSRRLSFSSDVYNAFIGIANLLYEPNYNESFFLGLPKIDFDRALRWYPWYGTKSAKRLDSGDLVCPTWSWSSAMVEGEQVRYQDTEFFGTLTLWFVQHENAECWSVLNIDPETQVDESWKEYMEIASQEGCLQSPSDHELSENMVSLTTQEANCWPDYHGFCQSMFGAAKIQRGHASAFEKVGPGHIVATVQIASFRLGHSIRGDYGVSIVGTAGVLVGELCGEIIYFKEEALGQVSEDRFYEFAALSLSGLHIQPYTEEERVTKNYENEDGVLLNTLPVINVFLIERQGGAAYRKELGWIYLKDWAKADRRWETIAFG